MKNIIKRTPYLPSELKELRRRLDIVAASRQTNVSAMLLLTGFSKAHVNNIINGDRALYRRHIELMSKTLKIPLGYLLLEDVQPHELVSLLRL